MHQVRNTAEAGDACQWRWKPGQMFDSTHAIAHAIGTWVAVATRIVAVCVLAVNLAQLLGLG